MKRRIALAFTALLLLASAALAAGAMDGQPPEVVSCVRNMNFYGIALEIYALDHQGDYPPTLQDLLPDYLKTLPQCPSGGDCYQYTYDNKVHTFSVVCSGHHHDSVAADYPRVTHEQGISLTEGQVVRPAPMFPLPKGYQLEFP